MDGKQPLPHGDLHHPIWASSSGGSTWPETI